MLVETILDIRDKIVAGVFVNEGQVSKGVVMRLLRDLGWDVHDPKQVSAEHAIGNRRVDYALCCPAFGTAVLIEVKRLGRLRTKGEEQLFDYCAKQGVPLAVLTDGRSWNLYFPGGMGSYEQRKFAVVDLVEDVPEKSAEQLGRYLEFGAVESGESHERVIRDHQRHWKQIVARRHFPAVFEALVSGADSRLVELFRDEVEEHCRIRPDAAEVADFLRDWSNGGHTGTRGPEPGSSPTPTPSVGRCRFILRGESYPCESGRALFVGVFRALAEQDSGFLERAARRVGGQVRPYLSRDRQEVTKGRDWSSPPAELPGGWWMRVQFRRSGMDRILRRAADAAGLVWGEELIVHWG